MKMMKAKKSIEILKVCFLESINTNMTHTLGITFVEKVSKLKFDMGKKRQRRCIKDTKEQK